MTDSALLPIIDDTNEPFWRGCREGVLRLQQCPVSQAPDFSTATGQSLVAAG